MVTISELKVLLSADNSDLKAKLGEAEGSVNGFGGVADKALGVATKAAVAFGAASVALIGTGVKIASDLEQAEIRFETLLGSGEKAKAFMEELKAFSLTTPFKFDELAGAAQKMISLGVATDQVIPLMQGVGDAAQALGAGGAAVGTITDALAKVQQQGFVTTREIQAIANTGVPAFEFLAKKLGTDVPTAMQMVQDKAVDSGTFIAAFMEGTAAKFGGAMERQSRTLEGVISSAKDQLGLQLAGIAGPVLEALTPLIPVIGGALGEILTTLGPSMTQFTTLLAGALSDLLPLLMPIVNALAAVIPMLLDGATEMLPAFQELLAAIIPIVVVLVDALKPILEVVISLVRALLPVLVLVAGVLRVLTPLFEALNPILELLAKVLVPIINFIALIIDALVNLVLALTGNREAWERFADALRAIGETTIAAVKALWGGLVDWFQDLGQRIIDGLIDGIRNAWEGVKDFVSGIAEGVGDAFKNALGISSPSRVFMGFGENIVAGLAAGLGGFEDVLARTGLGGDFRLRLPNVPASAAAAGGPTVVYIDTIEVPVTEAGEHFDPETVGDAVGSSIRRAIQEATD